MDSHKGFTLIEMAMVMAILAITLSYAVPYTRSWIENTRIRSAADSLQNGLRLAQMEALKRNQQVEFVLTNTSPTVANVGLLTANANGKNWVIRVDTSTTATPAYSFIQSKAGNEGSSSVAVASSSATIIFSALGRVAGAIAQAQIDFDTPLADDRPLRVVISPAGRIKMCDPAKPAGDAQSCT